LNDPDEGVRWTALKGLARAFPEAENVLDELVNDVQSEDPKVRLAASRRIITILAAFLSASLGPMPAESSPSGKQADAVTEGLMEYAGRWVAWSRNRERVIAVADTYADVMKQALAAGEANPFVKKAPGISPTEARQPFTLLEDESPDILEDLKPLIPELEEWLDTPNVFLGGEKPRDLIGTDREEQIRDLLRGIKHGISS
jgi:hypothetical protein